MAITDTGSYRFPASRQPTDASETYVSDLRAAFGWESLPHHRRYCQGGTERSGATAITITRLAVAGRTVAGDALTGGIV